MNGTVSVRTLVLVALVCVATALAISRLANRSADGEAGATRNDAAFAIAELSQRIAGLESALRDIRVLIEHNAVQSAVDASTSSARVPQGLTAASNEALATRIQALETAITALGADLSTALADTRTALATELKSSIAAGLVAAGPRAEPMPATMPDRPPDVARFQALHGLELEETSASHLLWTYEQVGQTYGRPTQVYPSPGGIGIKYAYEFLDGTQFTFWFVDGKVIRAFW